MSAITRVMVIEDDIAIAELHHRYLEQMGGSAIAISSSMTMTLVIALIYVLPLTMLFPSR